MSSNPKLIGSGNYGCVVSPPITTNIVMVKKPYTNKAPDDVGKLFKTTNDVLKEVLKEFMAYKTAVETISYYDKIVPKIKGYTIILKINSNTINNCIVNYTNDKEVHQLIYENAGKTFKDFPYYQLNYKSLLKMLKSFFIYFEHYVKAGKIHNDINSGNIMIKNNKILLIDFGLEKDRKTIFDSKYNKFFNHKYYFYPPEYRLCYLKEHINTKANVNFGFNNLKDLMNPVNGNFDIMSKQYILDEIGDLLNNFSTDYSKIDVFSIGVNLYLIRDKIIFGNTKDYDDFNYLIKKMIEPNHKKRFSISEVIKYAS
jgi:hypothetical protein